LSTTDEAQAREGTDTTIFHALYVYIVFSKNLLVFLNANPTVKRIIARIITEARSAMAKAKCVCAPAW